MKTKEEIEQLADRYSAIGQGAGLTHREYTLENIAYRRGYEQCQEDTEQEINRLKKIMIESSNQAMTWEEKYWQLKNSLNKQD